MLNIVTFRWKPYAGYRSTFPPETVQVLANMLHRHYHAPFHFICYTDAPEELRNVEGVEVRQMWKDLAHIRNPTGPDRNPNCYPRLKLFAPGMRHIIGQWILWLDLDCVITADVTPLFCRTADFTAWGETRPDNHYNGSMGLLRAGALPHVWEDFDPATSPAEAKAAGFFGSDQGWLSYKLGPGYPVWGTDDGVYSYRKHLCGGREEQGNPEQVPDNARIVMFHGHVDPWSEAGQRLGWVRECYR